MCSMAQHWCGFLSTMGKKKYLHLLQVTPQGSTKVAAAAKMSSIKPKESISQNVPSSLQVSQQQLQHHLNSIYCTSGRHYSTVYLH